MEADVGAEEGGWGGAFGFGSGSDRPRFDFYGEGEGVTP